MACNMKNVCNALKEYWDNNDDFTGIVYIREKANDGSHGLFSVNGNEDDVIFMLTVIADACGISMKELAYVCIEIATDYDAMNFLKNFTNGIKRDEDDNRNKGKTFGASQNSESQEDKKCEDCKSPSCHSDNKQEAIEKLLQILLADDLSQSQ